MKNFLPSIRGRSKSPKKNRQRTTISKNYEQADNSAGVTASNTATPNNTTTGLAVSPKAYNDELTQVRIFLVAIIVLVQYCTNIKKTCWRV